MKLEKITSAASPMMAAIHSLYMSSFPVEERRPWESITQLVESGSPFFSLLAATDEEGRFTGFATLWKLPSTYYIEHLAVEQAERSKGVGGWILGEITALAGDSPVVVEVELPESNVDAPRRIAFYERHGFTPMPDFPYFQPPYAPGLPDVQLMLMTTKPLADLKTFVIMLHTLVYNQ